MTGHKTIFDFSFVFSLRDQSFFCKRKVSLINHHNKEKRKLGGGLSICYETSRFYSRFIRTKAEKTFCCKVASCFSTSNCFLSMFFKFYGHSSEKKKQKQYIYWQFYFLFSFYEKVHTFSRIYETFILSFFFLKWTKNVVDNVLYNQHNSIRCNFSFDKKNILKVEVPSLKIFSYIMTKIIKKFLFE